MVKAVGYVRVSTRDQVQGQSLSVQENAIRSRAREHGYKRVQILRDEGVSGRSTKNREGLRQVFEMAENAGIEALYVYDMTRFGRNSRDIQNSINTLREQGVKVIFIKQSIDLETSTGRMFMQILAAIAEMESFWIEERTRDGKIEAATRDKSPVGPKPWGRTWSKKDGWGTDKKKVKIIEDIAKRIVRGESPSKIAAQNARRLKSGDTNYLGISSHSKLLVVLKERSGTAWKRTFHVKNDLGQVIDTIEVEYEVPELFDDRLRQKVLDRIDANKTFNGVRKYNYLLKGRIWCATCGSPLVGEPVRGNLYYRHRRPKAKCKNFFNSIPAQLIERFAIVQLYKVFGDRERIEVAIDRAIPDPKERRALEKKIKGYEEKIKEARKRKQNILDITAIGNFKDDMDIVKRLETENEIIEDNQAEIDKIKQRLSNMPTETEMKDAAEQVIKDVEREFTSEESFVNGFFMYRKSKSGDETDPYVRQEGIDRLLNFALPPGKDQAGNRCGVYVKKSKGGWDYEIRSMLIQKQGKLSENRDRW
ncbi:recombinase family protein, partial [Thermodesulfobacteriota bacterium]